MQYWVVYALLTVVESLINAAYWFREYPDSQPVRTLLTCPAFYYTFKFALVMWMALPQTRYVVRFTV